MFKYFFSSTEEKSPVTAYHVVSYLQIYEWVCEWINNHILWQTSQTVMFGDDNSSARIVSGGLDYSCLYPLLVQMPYYYSVLIDLLFIYELVSIWLDQFGYSLQPDLEFLIYNICL